MIAGLAAQKMDLTDAALLAAYIHGRAGDLLKEAVGEWGIMASMIPGEISKIIRDLKKESKQY
jgi:NAD(P)H-hydrate repair Nnr-like enzyme with NAD(P)H-hydrate dehydratase domain